ncbi:MAG: SDR family NAD(P)-dependent oxidoreductase [Planctomycetota bacterium]
MNNRFSQQTAIVTGGAAGIGRAVAHRLAREGATVCIWDIDRAAIDACVAAFTVEGLSATGAVVDVAEEAPVSAAIDAAVQATGRLDVIVHCAGIVGPNQRSIVDVSIEDYDRVYRINQRGSFLVTKHAVRAMLPRRYGRILLFASIAGKEGNAGMSPYSSTKAAVIGLAKSVGKEYAESGITVNAIAPGVIRTGLVDAMDPRQVAYMTDKIPMKRTGTLDEAAAMSAWIVSPECAFTTGFAFDLSGGRATY